MALTPKQAAFVQEYLIDLNGKQAAIRAGYQAKTAEVQASKMLSKGKVQLAVQEGKAILAKRREVTADRIIAEYAKIAFANTLDYVRVNDDGHPVVDLSAMTVDQAAAISETQTETVWEGKGEDAQPVRKVKLKFHDKKGALDSLSRHLGLFNDKVDITTAGQALAAPVIYQLPDNGRDDSKAPAGSSGTLPSDAC